jgi:hypothetical protein
LSAYFLVILMKTTNNDIIAVCHGKLDAIMAAVLDTQ